MGLLPLTTLLPAPTVSHTAGGASAHIIYTSVSTQQTSQHMEKQQHPLPSETSRVKAENEAKNVPWELHNIINL